MERAVLVGMAATACFIASGCDTGCTEEGCVDGVEVWFASPLDASSELSVSVQLDAEQIQCDYAKAKALDSCAQKGVWIQTSGSGAELRIDGFILVHRHPQQVTFAFSASGTVLVSATVTPSYTTEQPNGPDCPETCKNALVKL